MSDLHSLQTLVGCPYWLMDGLGNDFVIVDLRAGGVMTADAAKALGDRAGPFGCDQIITLEKDQSDDGTVFMGIWNADGSPAGACGNAARCVAHLLMSESETDKVTLSAPGPTRLKAWQAEDSISVDMGRPKLDWEDIPLAEPFEDTRFIDIKLGPIDAPVLWGPSAVSMGNPHCLFFVSALEDHDLSRFGPMIEHHPLFPEQANVSLVEVRGEEAVAIKTWERGVGLTQACGTAACASVVAAVRRRQTGREVTVTMPGGDLHIHWRPSDDRVIMTGPISLNGQGVFGDEGSAP